MLGNYFKIALRNIARQKMYSILNIAGLSLGITCCILLLLYVQFELSYDKYHENADRVYRIIREGKAFTPAPLASKLMEDIPEIAFAARLVKRDDILIAYQNKHFLEDDFYWADPEILKIFTIPFIEGDAKTALNDPSSILLSNRISKKYFKDENPIGKVILVGGNSEFIVSGIFSDMPANSHLNMDFIAPCRTFLKISGNDETNWFRNFAYTYFVLRKGADPDVLESKLPSIIDDYIFKNLPPEIISTIKEPYPRIFYAQPLTKIHLHSHLRQEISANNDIKYIFLFSSIAFLILIIACINYINLGTARASRRAKEVGIRKVAGAQRKQLLFQFFGESVILTIISVMISIVLLELSLPVFNNLAESHLHFDPFANPMLFPGLFLLAIFTGVLAGSYPALYLSGLKPVIVLKGSLIKSARGITLRNILVITQFSITIFLIICTLVIRNQLNFVKNMDVGYSKQQIITLPIRDGEIRRQIETLKTGLMQYPDILGVSTSARLPNNIDNFTEAKWTGKKPDEGFLIGYNTADYNFIDLFDLKIIEGRNFSKAFPSDRNGAFLLNEAAAKAAPLKYPLGQEFIHWQGSKGKVVGIVKDFNFRSLHNPIEPLYIFLDPLDFSYISIKIKSADIPATIEHVKKVMHGISPDYPFEYSFFDELFEKAYHAERRLLTIFSAFTLLAILIACLGLLGLVSYSTEIRVKEIGIRRVLGASVSGIFLLLSKEFFKWILISNLIAWPVAFIYSGMWLQNFAYRTTIGIWIFLGSSLLALIIALLTVSFQAIKAATANPVESLRYE